MSKQTAVDWLIDQIVNHNGVNSKTFEQAKAMEREQRFQDFKEGFQAAFDSLQGANNSVQSKKFKGGEQ